LEYYSDRVSSLLGLNDILAAWILPPSQSSRSQPCRWLNPKSLSLPGGKSTCQEESWKRD
jgi:hypothetical protein